MLGLRAPQPIVGRLGPRRLQLRLGLLESESARGAAVVEILSQLRGAGVIRDRAIEQLLLRLAPRSVK